MSPSSDAVRTLKLTLAYDGARYVGWQRQASGRSVQEVLEDALAPLEGGRLVRVTGAGRTDAGVHAQGQVASCRVRSPLPEVTILRALNARLPLDVRVLQVAEAPAEFHARFWARAKTYAYHILNTPVDHPLARGVVWHVSQALDITAMRRALLLVRGSHDFRAFQASGSRVSTTVRTLSRAALSVRPWSGWPGSMSAGGTREGTTGDISGGAVSAAAAPVVCLDEQQPGRARPGLAPIVPAALITLEFRGDGFLRHMVRNIVGTIAEVGLCRRDPESVGTILAGGDRRRAGVTAPPQGLCLVSVEYGAGPVDLVSPE